ncbi:MAG: GNAT family N-acetyltransferase [Bryobacter sp.]|nr:GNAT family N-acetyltransferase [Bryobacter sp.]
MPRFWIPFVEQCVRLAKAGEVWDLGGGVRGAWGNCLLPFTNEYYLTEPHGGAATDGGAVSLAESLAESLARQFARAKEDAAPRQLPWVFLLPNEGVNTLGFGETDAVAAREGLAPFVLLAEMTGDVSTLAPPRRPLPALRMERIVDRAGCALGMGINLDAYAMPRDFLESTVDAGMFYARPDRDFGYLAYDGEVPVSTAEVVELDGWLYVAAVATAPGQQRKGYAEAVMRYALEQASQALGITRTALDASEMGAPVYAAMGYKRTGAEWRVYGLPH